MTLLFWWWWCAAAAAATAAASAACCACCASCEASWACSAACTPLIPPMPPMLPPVSPRASSPYAGDISSSTDNRRECKQPQGKYTMTYRHWPFNNTSGMSVKTDTVDKIFVKKSSFFVDIYNIYFKKFFIFKRVGRYVNNNYLNFRHEFIYFLKLSETKG